MPASEKRTFSLPAEQAAFIDAQVASGAFATASEVVRAGLRALQERDAAVERESAGSQGGFKSAYKPAAMAARQQAGAHRLRHPAFREVYDDQPVAA